MLLSCFECSASPPRCVSRRDDVTDSLGLGAGRITAFCLAMDADSRLIKWRLHARVPIVSNVLTVTLLAEADTFSQTFHPASHTPSSHSLLLSGGAGDGSTWRILAPRD